MQTLNRILICCFLLLVPATALAATDLPPSPDTDAAAWVKALYEAVTSKKWSVIVGLVLVGLVYVARRWALGWITWFKTPLGGLVLGFLIALAGTLGIALAAGVTPSLALVATSLSSAAVAAGVWEWIKDHIPGAKVAAEKAVVVTPARPEVA